MNIKDKDKGMEKEDQIIKLKTPHETIHDKKSKKLKFLQEGSPIVIKDLKYNYPEASFQQLSRVPEEKHSGMNGRYDLITNQSQFDQKESSVSDDD